MPEFQVTALARSDTMAARVRIDGQIFVAGVRVSAAHACEIFNSLQLGPGRAVVIIDEINNCLL